MAIRPWLLPFPVLGTACQHNFRLSLSPQLQPQSQLQLQLQLQHHSPALYGRARARHRHYSSTNGPQSQSQSQSQMAASSAGGRRSRGRFIVPIFGLLPFTVGIYELGHWRGRAREAFGDGAGAGAGSLLGEGIFMAPRRSKILNMPDEAPQYASLHEMMKASGFHFSLSPHISHSLLDCRLLLVRSWELILSCSVNYYIYRLYMTSKKRSGKTPLAQTKRSYYHMGTRHQRR